MIAMPWRRDDRIGCHNGWSLMRDDVTEDFPRFEAWSFREGEARPLEISRFHFNWTQSRFNWLVDNGFPRGTTISTAIGVIRVPWSDRLIDEMMGGSIAQS